MQFSVLFNTCFAILALVFVGYFGARSGMLTEDFSKMISSLVMNVFLPASVFTCITDGMGQLSVRQLPHILLMLTLFLLISYAAAWALTFFLARRSEDPAALELSLGVMNTLLVGLPILQGVYGPLAVLYTGMSNLPFNGLLYTYGVWRLGSTSAGAHGPLRLRDMISMCLATTLVALVFFCFSIPVPGFVNRTLSIAAGATTPLSMIVVGITMGSENLLDALKDKRVYLISLVRLVLVPLLVWLILRPLTQDALLLRVCVVLAGCPTGIIVPILTLQYGHDATLASNATLVSTLLSLITLPVMILLMA